MDAVVITENAELHERLKVLPLFDALTDEPIALGPFIQRRLDDARAWQALWAEKTSDGDIPPDRRRTTLFWLGTLIDNLESIQLRHRIEQDRL